jgi:hypothetical protein
MANGWLPTKRVEILNMAKVWLQVLISPADNQSGGLGPPETWATRWRVPPEAVATLETLINEAEPVLQAAIAAKYRDSVISARLDMVFGALITHMKYLNSHFFLEPELHPDNFAVLLLRSPDHTRTPTGWPDGQVQLEFFLIGRHQLGFRVVFLSGDPKGKANKGFRIYFRITAQGEPYPTSPEELTESFFTYRHRDVMDFAFGDSGKMVHVAVQVENDGKKGPWGPLVSALIP